jgi:rRNA maturation RNase YbeY
MASKSYPHITIKLTKSFEDVIFSQPKLNKLVRSICRRFIARTQKNNKYQISIVIVDDSQFRKLNRRFLQQSRSSDCLSFDLSDRWSTVFELIINGEKAKKQASLRGHTDEAELALYVTHSLLHNFGFDDITPGKARKMHEMEDAILQQNLYGLVYDK